MEAKYHHKSREINSHPGIKPPFISSKLQTKLKIGAPHDKFEKEADSVADQVVRGSNQVQKSQNPGPIIQRKCTACEEEELQRKPLLNQISTLIQTKSNTSNQVATDSFSSQIQASKGSGMPMDSSTQHFMENSFGSDFSSVNIHNSNSAAQLNQQINARAFTVGNDIFFNSGEYQPHSNRGKHLLAHELTHTLQQNTINRTSVLQRETITDEVNNSILVAPLSEQEWLQVRVWQERGEVGIEPLTENAVENAAIIADAIFCGRLISSSNFFNRNEDPLLCGMREVTFSDPRFQQVVIEVGARGPILNLASAGSSFQCNANVNNAPGDPLRELLAAKSRAELMALGTSHLLFMASLTREGEGFDAYLNRFGFPTEVDRGTRNQARFGSRRNFVDIDEAMELELERLSDRFKRVSEFIGGTLHFRCPGNARVRSGTCRGRCDSNDFAWVCFGSGREIMICPGFWGLNTNDARAGVLIHEVMHLIYNQGDRDSSPYANTSSRRANEPECYTGTVGDIYGFATGDPSCPPSNATYFRIEDVE